MPRFELKASDSEGAYVVIGNLWWSKGVDPTVDLKLSDACVLIKDACDIIGKQMGRKG